MFSAEDHRVIRQALARYRASANDYADAYQEALIALWRCENDSPAYRNVVARHAVLGYLTGTAAPFGSAKDRRRYPVKEEQVGDLMDEDDAFVLGSSTPVSTQDRLSEWLDVLPDPRDRMITEALAHGLQLKEVSLASGHSKGWAADRWRFNIKPALASYTLR